MTIGFGAWPWALLDSEPPLHPPEPQLDAFFCPLCGAELAAGDWVYKSRCTGELVGCDDCLRRLRCPAD